MTYTVMARCPRTGAFGIALATYTLAVGQYCNGLLAGKGIAMSQASVRQANSGVALDLLERGFTVEYILEALMQDDKFNSFRQTGVIDRDGNAACHTGSDTRDWKGHRTGPGMIAMGNVLLGPQVVDAMAEGFNARTSDPLPERLLFALERGRDAGGQSNGKRRMPERSAALVVVEAHDYPAISLRVDLHDKAIDELRRLYTRYQPYVDYYRQRDLQPQSVPNQEVFEEGFGGQTLYQA